MRNKLRIATMLFTAVAVFAHGLGAQPISFIYTNASEGPPLRNPADSSQLRLAQSLHNSLPEPLLAPSDAFAGPTSQVESMFSEIDEAFPAVNERPEFAAAADDGDYGDSGYGGGLQWNGWGWLSYLRTPQRDRSTFWAYEFELGVRKTFTQHLAATVEIDFMDVPGREVFMEQMFVSVVLPNDNESILTIGKFNSPFGLEPRDFWNRVSASRSLLFRRLPQDLLGLMLTHRVENTNLTLRPMVVSGLVDSGFDNNEQPSLAIMAEYRPSDEFSLAATYWHGPEMDRQVGDKLKFIDAHIIWYPQPCFSLSGEYFRGATESSSGMLDWQGFLALANWDLNKKLRIFSQYSLFDDRDGFQTGVIESRKEVNVGFGWYLHPLVEIRGGYRHDYRPVTGDRDNWDLHLTFGY